MKNRILFLSALLVLFMPVAAHAGITADYLDSSFEEIFKVTDLQSIEMWEQPRTQYTPKNLVSEQQVRYSGKNGTNSYESYTFHVTDYDTKITKSLKDVNGDYYIQDNVGQYFKTGESLTESQKEAITQIPVINNQVTNMSNQINKTNRRIDQLDNKVNRLDNRMEQGFATVSALTALHPNPRYKGKTQVSVGTGMYADNFAGAIGIFHYLNDRIMLNAGAAYGGDSSWAGNFGITIGL